MVETSLEKRNGTSTDSDISNGELALHAPATPAVHYNPDAPSEEWGWHGSWREFAPRGSSILLGLGVVLLVLQNFTTHVSHVESYYYNGLALLGVLWMVSRARSSRRLRRERDNQR